MRRLSLVTLAAALVLAAPAAPALAQDRGSAQVAPPRVGPEWKLGVVDLSAVFKQYKRSSELEQKINDERNNLRNKLDEQRKLISKLNAELDALDPAGEAYQLKEDEKDSAVARLERMKRRLEESIKKKWEDYNLLLLDDIEQAVKAYGEDNRYTLILKVEGKPTEETRILAGLKSVMYSSPELDITAAIVTLLNKNWEEKKAKAEKSGGAAAPAPKPATPAAGGDGKK